VFRTIVAVTLLATSSVAVAEGAHGVWKTEASDTGGYLEVTIGPCESDPKLTCGIISNAFGKDGPDPDYENLGKEMILDMKPHGENSYAGGTIWDPEKDKTYKSKMTVKGDDLDVEGCISFVCIGEDCKRVK
jgi:uncharacterized protein (DUF2147 family)